MTALGDAVWVALAGSDTPAAGASQALPLQQSARLLGGYRWVEQRLFEVLGRWAATESLPEACLLFDVQSQQHAWHAELFEERLPVLDGFDPAEVTVAPSVGVERLLAGLAGDEPAGAASPAGADDDGRRGGTLLRLAGLGRVILPRLVAGYTVHLRRCAPMADAAVARVLRLVLDDDLDAWRATELMVQSLARRPHDLAVLTDHQRHWEELLLGHAGLAPWPAGAATDASAGPTPGSAPSVGPTPADTPPAGSPPAETPPAGTAPGGSLPLG